ncbi:MAG: GrpB family protein [Candidatus Limnocylindria bacterium]
MVASPLDPSLARRLADAGLDPSDFGNPAEAWLRLHSRFGRRATLLDRYALEAARRGLRPEQLDRDERARLAREVLMVQYPGIEFTASSSRAVADPVEVIAYQDSWPAAFDAWRGRLHPALGQAAVRIEHIGSTAVPGLPAKPVIDIQVSVRDIGDEAAYVPAITKLGVPLRSREPGHRYFRPGGDRPRSVQIHVCAAESEWERDHLLFRDYLRADPETRAAYARLKEELAERYRDDRLAYNEGKTGFILDALSEAAAWAERRRTIPQP